MSLKTFLGVAALFAAFSASGNAHADASSWAFVGSGPSWLNTETTDGLIKPTLQLDFGVGSPPTKRFVLGGIGRLQTHFGVGTDLGVALRLATGSFVRGDFGLALDAGPYQRFWGEKSTGGALTFMLGAPWGLTLGIGGGKDFAGGSGEHLTAVFGIDFARLTVYRSAGTDWFINPFPPERTALLHR
jgi:hypothetical protein